MTSWTPDPKLRFSHVVYGIETTPRALRRWLQDEHVKDVLMGHREGGWHSFSFFHVAALALMRNLIPYGVGVGNACGIASDVIFQRTDALGKLQTEIAPLAIAEMFREGYLFVWRPLDDEDESWHFDLISAAVSFDESDAYLRLDAARIIDRAIRRVLEMIEEASEAGE